jgi:hypothetical protein
LGLRFSGGRGSVVLRATLGFLEPVINFSAERIFKALF